MKNAIREFLEYNGDEKKELWESAIFVFDTNVLLNLYRYSKITSQTVLDAISSLNSRIWLPYHVANEFMKNRVSVILETERKYNDVTKITEEYLKKIKNEYRVSDENKDLVKLKNQLEEWSKSFKKENQFINTISEDILLSDLLKLFDGKTGKKYSDDELKTIFDEGKSRYEKKIPPGYKDKHKQDGNDNNNIYGDLIIWKEILKYAREKEVDIIFITEDTKEDWWNIISGKTIGPRVELRKEFLDEVNRKFHMYTMISFVNQYEAYRGEELNDVVKEEIVNAIDYHYSDKNKEIKNYKVMLEKYYDKINKEALMYNKEMLIRLNEQYKMLNAKKIEISKEKLKDKLLKEIEESKIDAEFLLKQLKEAQMDFNIDIEDWEEE